MKKPLITFLPLSLLTSCGTVQLKPFSDSRSEYDCFKEDMESVANRSRIEEELHKAGALKTKRVKMASEIGMIEKAATLYILNRSKFFMVFHFIHVVDLEIGKYSLSISDGASPIAAGPLTIDSKYTVGQATDEYLYYSLSEAEAKAIAGAENLVIRIDDLPFTIPYQCRETFRNALNVK